MSAPQRLCVDVNILCSQGYEVDVVEEGVRFYVIVYAVQLPEGYQPDVTNVMMMADYQYPMSALDMFWTAPHVKGQNGDWPMNANVFEEHSGKQWQRWSWHYPGWNPNTHSLITHLEVCFDRLAKAA